MISYQLTSNKLIVIHQDLSRFFLAKELFKTGYELTYNIKHIKIF